MLVGRDPERRHIATLMAGARVRQSAVLVLRGEAGIGKTALLDDAASNAGEMAVLRTVGSEHESGLSFSGLHQLLLPVLNLAEKLPEPQRDALDVALLRRRGHPPERFAVGAAALGLLSRCAEDRPLLVLVDDAHLLDQPSAETLLFVARRLVADQIAVLVALRPERDALLNNAALPTLDLHGLEPGPAAALVCRAFGRRPTAEAVARLHQATAGNPLGLLELSADLDRIAGRHPDLPLPVPDAVARAFTRRISALGPDAQQALLIAAIAAGDLAVAAQAAASLGAGMSALAEAEAVGLVELRAGRAIFRHPLVRSAIHAAAEPALRREAHRAVAATLPRTSVERRAWHLSEACVGPDDEVADLLSEVAADAGARAAYGVAAAALERSSELTSKQPLRGERLLRAGESAWFAGQVRRADEVLRRAADLVTDPVISAEIDGLRGNIALRAGSLRDARELLRRSAARVEPFDPDAAVLRLADVVLACFPLCDAPAAVAAAENLQRLIGGCATPVAAVRARLAIGIARVLAGEAGTTWIRAGVQRLTQQPGLIDDARRPDWAVLATLFLREAAAGRDLIDRVVTEQRTRAALGTLPNLLFYTSRDHATTDRWVAAADGYDESITLARETGQTTDLAASLAGLAWLQARMGRAAECRAHAVEALALAECHDIVLARVWAQFALGDLGFALGDTDEALRRYRELQATLAEVGFLDVDVSPGPEIAELQMRTGDRDRAAETAALYLRRARDKAQPWALARAYRAAALTSEDPGERTALFERALEMHADTLDLFEEARTRLAFGATLRRGRTRVAARPHLRAALEAFERLGARPWSDLAASELNATGEHVSRGSAGYLAQLTSQETRIARMLAVGKTTKETAAALFLSPKTVEYHLRHVYDKLGISSRSELSAALDRSAV
jgi:DNA-binding CsgD family transcriptional regulator